MVCLQRSFDFGVSDGGHQPFDSFVHTDMHKHTDTHTHTYTHTYTHCHSYLLPCLCFKRQCVDMTWLLSCSCPVALQQTAQTMTARCPGMLLMQAYCPCSNEETAPSSEACAFSTLVRFVLVCGSYCLSNALYKKKKKASCNREAKKAHVVEQNKHTLSPKRSRRQPRGERKKPPELSMGLSQWSVFVVFVVLVVLLVCCDCDMYSRSSSRFRTPRSPHI